MSHLYIHVSIQASMYSSNYLIKLHWEPTVVDSALIARDLNKNQLQSPNFSIVVTVQSKFYLFSKHFASIYYLSVTPLLYRILFYGYQFSVNFNASHTKWPYYLCWIHSLFFSTHMCVPRSCPLQSLTRLFWLWLCFSQYEIGGQDEKNQRIYSFSSFYWLWFGSGCISQIWPASHSISYNSLSGCWQHSLFQKLFPLLSPFRPNRVNDLPVLLAQRHYIILCWFPLILGYICKLCFYSF